MHALIIEQDMWIIMMIEDALRELGYTSFAIASSAEAALDEAGKRCPDLITAEVRLGADSGTDAVRALCSGRPIPVVYVTATPWEAREAHAGAVVVPKPFGQHLLKEGVIRARSVPAG